MKISISRRDLVAYVTRQLNTCFPDGVMVKEAQLERRIDLTLDRVSLCFRAINNRYFQVDGHSQFNHLHNDQYSMFLYFLSNTLFKEGEDIRVCEKLFYLNKMLNGIDAFYEIALPDIFIFSHPLGTVLGRATYADHFIIYQGCTIGSARGAKAGEKSIFPVLGKFCSVYKGAAVLGNCHGGDNCKISAHSLLIDRDLDANKIYIGTRLNNVIKDNRGPDSIWVKT